MNGKDALVNLSCLLSAEDQGVREQVRCLLQRQIEELVQWEEKTRWVYDYIECVEVLEELDDDYWVAVVESDTPGFPYLRVNNLKGGTVGFAPDLKCLPSSNWADVLKFLLNVTKSDVEKVVERVEGREMLCGNDVDYYRITKGELQILKEALLKKEQIES